MNIIQFKKSGILLLGFLFFLGSCNQSAWENLISGSLTSDESIMQVIASKPELSVFNRMLQKTGYNNLLESSNSFTVFAPANTFWTGVDTTNLVNLTKQVSMLIVYNTYFSDNKQLYEQVTSVNGKNIFYDSGAKTFNGAKITTADIPAANGVIHITEGIVERKESVWDYLSTKTEALQFQFVNSLNRRVMDMEKSVAIGVYSDGRTKYDTVWMNVNTFLESYRLDREDSVYTYIILENTGFEALYDKYKPYFTSTNAAKTDSITRGNICADFVFSGNVDITKFDTLLNVDNVKIPIAGSVIREVYNASNGRVYVVDQSNVKLREKIKPVFIEGEKFNSAYNRDYVFTRYKRWASGERDVVLSCAETQSDSLWRTVPLAPDTIVKKDSVASKTYFINSGLVANVANFYIEYKAKVNSANYDVYYMAYDDIADHFDHGYTRFGVYRLIQKLFVSMPGSPVLRHGTSDNTRGVANNYLGDLRCFVGDNLAGFQQLTKLRQYDLAATTQLVSTPVISAAGEVMAVPRTGTMTLWLCNTARSVTASRQGLLFLDYMILVPRITED